MKIVDQNTPHDYRYFAAQSRAEAADFALRNETRENGLIVEGDHCHRDFFALYLVCRGCATHIIDGAAYAVVRGDVYLMAPGQTHRFQNFAGMEMEALYFRLALLDDLTINALEEAGGLAALRPGSRGGRALHLAPPAYDAALTMLTEAREEWASRTLAGSVLARGLCVRLLLFLTRWASRTNPASGAGGREEPTVAAALRMIDERFAEPLHIEDVAAALAVSPDHLAKQFAAVVGRTPREYLTTLRMERAKTLLRDSSLPISEIGVKCGYLDGSYFARAFRAATGMPPREFRRRAGQG